MKSILYVGATLMIGASIYGFVDYSKSRNNKEFNNMYAEKEPADPVISSENKVNGKAENNEVTSNVKKTAVKKQVAENVVEKIIEPDIPVTEEEKMITKELKKENTDVTVVPVKEDPSEKIVKKKKGKLNTKLFSRGALDERYLDEEKLKPEMPKSKKEASKTEIKEKI